jgi:hypothetical protein
LSYRHSFLLKRMGVPSILTSHYGHLHSLSDSLSNNGSPALPFPHSAS